MSFYASDSSSALAEDILLKCGKLYAKKYLAETTGVMGTPGATASITIASGVATDDLYNNKTLYIVDDNSKLATVNIDDSTASGDTITVDTTASLLVSDEATAGTFTSAVTYNLYILDSEEFVGYSTQSLDYEEETAEFLDCNELVVEDTTRIVAGFSGDVKNFSSDKTFANIFNLTQYGSQTSQKQYHGGFAPGAKDVYQVTAKTENRVSKDIDIQFFKGSFFGNGAIDLSNAGEYKVVPYQFKAYKDTLRDSGTVNGWSITEAT